MKLRASLAALGSCLLLLISSGCGTANNAPEPGTVAAPALTPVPGTYSAPLDVVMATSTADATIRYTTDGSAPTTANGTIYTAPVHVAETTTFQAVAYRSGWTTSSVTSGTYTIAPLVAAPTFSPAAGAYASPQDITLSTTTAGASIRYTTDGSTPTASLGEVYGGPVHLPVGEVTLKAVAYQTGWTTSLVTAGVYIVGPQAAAPVFGPAPGDYLDPQDVTISTSTPGAAIRYTADGSTPTDAVGVLYTGPVHVSADLTLKAVAFESGWRSSPVTSGTYTIGPHVAPPRFTPPPGTYSAEQDVAITTTTAGAAIRYTTDGTTPTETVGTVYTAPVRLSSSVTLKAVAYLSGLITSAVTSGSYTIGLTVAAPEFSAPPGNFSRPRNVAITTATSGATIRYTTDGSTPTVTKGTVYASPVPVDRTMTLKAVAYRSGWTTSSVTTGEYRRFGIGAGIYHSILAQSDGAVWTWGGNTEGQIGDGTTNPAAVPAPVPGLTGVIAVAAGYYHSIALKSDGTVWAWGRNLAGQLGNGTTNQSLVPVQAAGISGVTAVAGGENSTYALKSDGSVWAWGNNSEGQLGDGTVTDHYVPAPVQGLSSVVAIAAGQRHGVALKSNGTVWAWGSNTYGDLGDGSTTTELVPIQVPGLSTVMGIAANGYHTAAVLGDGTLWSWGSGYYGELGIGDQPMFWPSPVQAIGLSNVAAAAAGSYHTIAILADGTLRAFGFNFFGQLGDGTNANSSLAVTVLGLSSVIAVGASYDHTVAILADGTVWAWGHNFDYQLGDGTTTDRSTPGRIIP